MWLLNSALRAQSGIMTGLLGGPGRRLLTGGIVGGLIGSMDQEGENSPNSKLMNTLGGIGAGLGIAALTTRTPWSMAARGLKRIIKPSGTLLRAGLSTARTGLSAGSSIAKFTLRNPSLAMGIAGVGLGLYALGTSGTGASGMSINNMSTIASNNNLSSTGFAPGMGAYAMQPVNQSFVESGKYKNLANSTMGLTQALHRGRHG